MAKRLKIFTITKDQILPMLEGKLRVIGLPVDGKVYRIDGDWLADSITVALYSETFDENLPNTYPPMLDIRLESA